MRTCFNLAILLVLLAGGLVIAIALPDSRTAIEELAASGPQQPRVWIADIRSAPYRWGFYCAMMLAILLWLRPKKRTDASREPSRRASDPSGDDAGDWGESVSRAILVGLALVGTYFWFTKCSTHSDSKTNQPTRTDIREAQSLAVAAHFLKQFKKDFCKYDSDTPVALNMAGIPWRLQKHPRNGQHGYTVRMPDALRWARKWLPATDFKLLSRTVDHSATIWMSNYDLEVY